MNTNLPIKRTNNFIDKIKKIFKKLFWKNKTNNVEEINSSIESEVKIEKNVKNGFQGSLRVETKDEFSISSEKEEFLNEMEKNPNLLYELPIEKLERLEKYYDKSINEYKDKLSKLKKVG